MKHFPAMLASLLLGSSLFSGELPKQAEDPILVDKSFRAALTYVFACKTYWQVSPFLEFAFGDGQKPREPRYFSHLGEKISCKLSRQGDLLVADFGGSAPEMLRCIQLKRGENGEWTLDVSESHEPIQVIKEDYIFEIPLDFMRRASVFGDGVSPIFAKLKTALENVIMDSKDAPPGENHFFVGPFEKCVFPNMLYIYWVEKKELVFPRFSMKQNDISKLRLADFVEDDFLDSDGDALLEYGNGKSDQLSLHIKEAIYNRLSWSNTVVSNCVRDGKLITVVKSPP